MIRSTYRSVKKFVKNHDIEIALGVFTATVAVAASLHPEWLVEPVEKPTEKIIVEVHHYYHS